jgi:hypothetical protein
MAKARLPLAVPKLTPYEIKLGELCALDLWEGIDYQTGKHITRDELFLTNFGTPSASLYSGRRSVLNVTVKDFHHFVIVAGLKNQYQTANGTDLAKGIASFQSSVIPYYRTWKGKATTQSPVNLVTNAALDWSPCFVKNPNTGSRVGNHRISLACRFLFYAFPDFPVYNFSESLSEALNLQKRPQAALPHFNEAMALGMVTNKHLLSKTTMPQPTIVSLALWKRAEKNGWWKRRVLDLALLLHFRCVTARVELQKEARKLTRPKPKLKKVKPTQSLSAS